MKKMLLVYPNNFLQGAMGTNSRVAMLVSVFKEIGYEIDYFGYEHFTQDSSFRDFSEQNSGGIIHELFLYDFWKGYGRNGKKESAVRRQGSRVLDRLRRMGKGQYLQDWVPPGAKRMFGDILSSHEYDTVVFFYTFFASLASLPEIRGSRKIYFMEDCDFLQQYFWEKGKKGLTLGRLIDETLPKLGLFDEIFCISNDEKVMFEKLTGRKMHFLPHLVMDGAVEKKPFGERRWDVFFIGFDNPYNAEGLEWFLGEVHPRLDRTVRTVLVGSATKRIKTKYANVDVIPFAPSLEDIYREAKIAICPMFHGTGMKVKVVEAMAQGLPVVCNERGVDGLPDKTMSGCIVTEDARVFADEISRLAGDPDYYEEKAGEIREYYARVFDAGRYKRELEAWL